MVVREGRQTVTNRLGPLWFQLIVGAVISHSSASAGGGFGRRCCKYPARRHEQRAKGGTSYSGRLKRLTLCVSRFFLFSYSFVWAISYGEQDVLLPPCILSTPRSGSDKVCWRSLSDRAIYTLIRSGTTRVKKLSNYKNGIYLRIWYSSCSISTCSPSC